MTEEKNYTIHIEDTDKDIKRVSGDKSDVTESSDLRIRITSCLCLLHQSSPEGFVAVVNTSVQRTGKLLRKSRLNFPEIFIRTMSENFIRQLNLTDECKSLIEKSAAFHFLKKEEESRLVVNRMSDKQLHSEGTAVMSHYTDTMKVDVRSSQKWLCSTRYLSFSPFPGEASITLSVWTSISTYSGLWGSALMTHSAPWRAPLRKVWFWNETTDDQVIKLIVSIGSPNNTFKLMFISVTSVFFIITYDSKHCYWKFSFLLLNTTQQNHDMLTVLYLSQLFFQLLQQCLQVEHWLTIQKM